MLNRFVQFLTVKRDFCPHDRCSPDICSCGDLYEPWRFFCVKTPVDQQFLESTGQINSLKTLFLHILTLVWTQASHLDEVYVPQCLEFWPCNWPIGYLCRPEFEDMQLWVWSFHLGIQWGLLPVEGVWNAFLGTCRGGNPRWCLNHLNQLLLCSWTQSASVCRMKLVGEWNKVKLKEFFSGRGKINHTQI